MDANNGGKVQSSVCSCFWQKNVKIRGGKFPLAELEGGEMTSLPHSRPHWAASNGAVQLYLVAGCYFLFLFSVLKKVAQREAATEERAAALWNQPKPHPGRAGPNNSWGLSAHKSCSAIPVLAQQ